MKRTRRSHLQSTSAVALVCATASLAGLASTAPAAAQCALVGSGATVSVNCSGSFDSTVEFDPLDSVLLLFDNGTPTDRAATDLSGANEIIARDDVGIIGDLTVRERATGTTEPFLDLRGGDDVVDLRIDQVFGAFLGGAGNDTFRIRKGDVATDPNISDPALNGVAFSGGVGDDTIRVDDGARTQRLLGGAGADTFNIAGQAGVPNNSAFDQTNPVGLGGGDGDDVFVLQPTARYTGIVDGGAGADTATLDGTAFALPSTEGTTFRGGLGDDTVTVAQSADIFAVRGEEGDDTIRVFGAVGVNDDTPDDAAINGGAGRDTISIFDGAAISGLVAGGTEGDVIMMSGGRVEGVFEDARPFGQLGFGITGDEGGDTITLTGGTVQGFVFGGEADDTITVGGDAMVQSFGENTFGASVAGYSGRDVITIRGNAVVEGFVIADGDFIQLAFPTDLPAPFVPGDDEVAMSGGTVGGIFTGGGDDLIEVSGGTVGFAGVVGDPFEGSELTDSGGFGEVRGNQGDDTIRLTGTALIRGDVAGDAGRDTVTVDGATLQSDADGGSEFDTLLVRSGRIDGTILGFEDVTFGGDGGGVFATPFTIAGVNGSDGPATNVTIVDSTFGTGGASSLQLNGIDTLSIVGSTLSLSGDQSLQQASVTGGSVLDIVGSTMFNDPTGGGAPSGAADSAVFSNPAGGHGNLFVQNSTLDLINGSTDDSLTVGNLVFDSATLGVDVNPNTAESDTINVTGIFETLSAPDSPNTLLVNFVQDPLLGGEQVIPLVVIGSADASGATELDPNDFTVTAFSPGTVTSLALLQSPDGTLFLRTDDSGGIITSPTPPTLSASSVFVREAVGDVTGMLADNAVGFFGAGPAAAAAVTPTFGVYANGQAGRAFHDGFDVSGPGFSGLTPEFTADSFSLIGTAELDASAEFGLEDIGVRVSAFGGYVSTDVDLSQEVPGFGATPFRGSGFNQGGVFGAAVLVSKVRGLGHLDYGLFSAAGFLGETDVTLAGNGATGDYGTRGLILSAKGGRNIAVSDNVRLDLRFGAAYSAFRGDSFVDSSGNPFGATETSFGLLSFEPGVSTAIPVGGYVVAPFGRMLVQTRIGYDNTAKLAGQNFDFEDDANFIIGGQLGANVKFSDTLSAGASIEGRAAEGHRSVQAKLAVKYTIPRR